MKHFGVLASGIFMVLAFCAFAASEPRIDIYEGNPRYWAYDGSPIVLIGGSVEDNLYQFADLEAQLDLLKSVGGNYVRNTMSCRDEGNVWPFKPLENGQYDLDQWNDEHWARFERFLQLTSERGIIVQIEVWATFDYYQERWDRNPFNPKNTITYTEEETGLPTKVDSHPTQRGNNFFWSVPAEKNQATVLTYQQRFVDKLLSHSLQRGNVLYCMDNETAVTPEWGKYWSEFIKKRAEDAGVVVHTTEMWDPWNLDDGKHNATFDHPETYSFVDISQNNHQKGQAHWDNAQRQRARIAGRPRPLNNTKIYGADGGPFGDSRDGMERFWRNIVGGLASARFHRPDAGLGLSAPAQANIRSMRMMLDELNITVCEPHNELLAERTENEAYCTANPGIEYAVYFPRGGEVLLDATALTKPAQVRWLNIMTGSWSESSPVEAGASLNLACPDDGSWVALIG